MPLASKRRPAQRVPSAFRHPPTHPLMENKKHFNPIFDYSIRTKHPRYENCSHFCEILYFWKSKSTGYPPKQTRTDVSRHAIESLNQCASLIKKLLFFDFYRYEKCSHFWEHVWFVFVGGRNISIYIINKYKTYIYLYKYICIYIYYLFIIYIYIYLVRPKNCQAVFFPVVHFYVLW